MRTIPGVGPITALTWALAVGDTSRFRSIKQAISYCGLCSAEKSSADKVMRTPISRQRNKHIQQVQVEAARLAPRYSEDAHAPRINRGMVYLGASLIAGIRMQRERRVNVRINQPELAEPLPFLFWSRN